jgi:magnesium transporter
MTEGIVVKDPLDSLNKAFMLNYPVDAARRIATMTPTVAAETLKNQPIHIVVHIFDRLSHGVADAILRCLPDEKSAELLSTMDSGLSTSLLSRLEAEERDHYLSLLGKGVADELRGLLEYPEDSAGGLMQTKISAFNENTTVDQAISHLKLQKIQKLRHIFLLDDTLRLTARVDMQRLALAEAQDKLLSISIPIAVSVQALDPKSEVLDKLNKFRVETLPVVDINFRLVGTIEGQGLIEALREDIVTDMQTMVGVSKDERALSSSWFAVRKRMPWLQINLLTAFLASAVVGMFESTIAKYTALAILLPIAAGQSGNTGAQALAVTMRGLTLREITIRHWLRVLR